MSLALELSIRIVAAALIGAVIGYERELRGKGAGVRTHVLVALGSALFMILSIYGFPEGYRFDASRIAAGVVGGLGFLGGGIIMKNKRVSGLTTAAGIWVTGAIGMAVGAGMYSLSLLCTAILIICMEALHYYSFKYGERQVSMTLSAEAPENLQKVVSALGKQVILFSMSRQSVGFKGDFTLLIKKQDYPFELMKRMEQMEGVRLESLD